MNRRYFTRLFSALPFIPVTATHATSPPAAPLLAGNDRAYWLQTLLKIAHPVLTSLAEGQLKATMPVESAPGQEAGRRNVTYLEVLAEPWRALLPGWNIRLLGLKMTTAKIRRLSTAGHCQRGQPTVARFHELYQGWTATGRCRLLAHGLLRAPTQLWQQLDKETQARLVTALKASRAIKPGYNNWLLFSAMVEAALLTFTGEGDELRMDYAIKQHETWYKGDGAYGDGPDFHWDYYNSYVIQPMLLDVVQTLVRAKKADQALLDTIQTRAQRYAQIQERLIGPDGSFAAFGRSLAYRCGAFQLLAQMALQKQLPAELPAGQVRNAHTAVIRRTMEAPGTFDAKGWLQIGLVRPSTRHW